MAYTPIPYMWNRTTSVVKQGKYRISMKSREPVVEVLIETADDMRIYPSSKAHPQLVEMVNAVKTAAGLAEGGQFYINEYRQVIVPATNFLGDDGVDYFYAGEYRSDIILALDGKEFSGRPIDENGRLLSPGDSWSGRPRPGICYTLKAGGEDIEFLLKISPGSEQRYRLSRFVGAAAARKTAAKIARTKSNKGGKFFVNEFRTMFCPVRETDFTDWLIIGILTDEDPWYPKWNPGDGLVKLPLPRSGGRAIAQTSPVSLPRRPAACIAPEPRRVEIEDGATGFTYDNLFGPYLQGASEVILEDPYLAKPHQAGNLLRFAELCVRLGSVKVFKVVTTDRTDDGEARIESIRRSLERHGIDMRIDIDRSFHDRLIATDTGWKISLGRGLDIYKRPQSFLDVGATDFALRPCHKTTIIASRDTIEENDYDKLEEPQSRGGLQI